MVGFSWGFRFVFWMLRVFLQVVRYYTASQSTTTTTPHSVRSKKEVQVKTSRNP